MFRNTRVLLCFKVTAFCILVGKNKEIKLFHWPDFRRSLGGLISRNSGW